MSTVTEEKTPASAPGPGARSRSTRIRNRRNAATLAAGIKLLVFTIVSLLVTGLLAAIMGNVGFGSGTEYKAVFSNASMLGKGDDVRVAGVSVGEVKKVEHYQRTKALVTFRVKSDVPLTTTSRAEIRFLNLVGDRYLALEAGDENGDALPDTPDGQAVGADAPATGARLDAGDTIPVERTTPALDLTTLFNGFQPLFQALTPDQVNQLSMNLVQVLQGEGGTIQELLARTASLTNSLADRDQLIGQVVTNLSTTLDTVDQRHQELNTLVSELQRWMADLARDRSTIGGSLDNISDLTVVVADLLRAGPAAGQGRRGRPQEAGEAAQRAGQPAAGGRAARPAARVDDRPDPDRHLRVLVQLLRLRLLRTDHPARQPGHDPRSPAGPRRHRQPQLPLDRAALQRCARGTRRG